MRSRNGSLTAAIHSRSDEVTDQGRDRQPVRDTGTSPDTPAGAPTDAGRTSGGGSLGHAPTEDVQEQTNIRNNPRSRKDDTDTPGDEATLTTRI